MTWAAKDRPAECSTREWSIWFSMGEHAMTTLPARCDPAADARQRAENLLLDARRRTDEFLATLGHEMRNPLSALSNALQVWPTHDPALMEELRGIMLRQVRQLTHLSDDLLDVARIAQGKLELRREQIGLRELIEGACEEVRPFIERCGHALTIKLPHEPITIHGDPSRLLQVFANLIQNAAKFTGRNGRLTVTVEAHQGMAVVRVRDDGPGIELDLLPLLFEVVPPVDKPRAPVNDGLGIGLRLVKTIVELHGGAVAAHSEGLGKGSEFTVQLPASVGAPPGQLPATGQSAESG
jgi:signal transduction histidine kinase